MAQTIGSLDLNAFSDLYSDSTQYFWFESNASATYGAGAHVTLVPDTSFISNPTGQNILMNTDGFSIRNGLLPMMTLDNDSLEFNVVDTTEGTYVTTATFSSTGSQIGQTGESHIEMDYHSMQLIDKEGAAYFHVSDLRSDHTDADEYGEGFYTVITERFIANGISKLFAISNTPFTENYKVYVNGIEESDVVIDGMAFRFTTAPTEGSIVTATYPTAVQYAKAYTAGLRKNGEIIGIMSFAEGHDTIASGMKSHAEGWNTTASGYYSHAEGVNCIASGNGSHAEGTGNTASGDDSHAEGALTTASGNDSHAQNYDTIAGYWAQTAIGKYNDNQLNNAFEIGNGTSDSARSNALTVDWDGNVVATSVKKSLGYTGEYITIAGNQTPSESAGQVSLSTSYKNCFPTNKYSESTSSVLANDLFSVSGGIVTILKAGRYKVDYQIYTYTGFTVNDYILVSAMYNGNAANARASRMRAWATNPYTTLRSSCIINAAQNSTIGVSAENQDAARGCIGLSALTRMTIECLAIYE